MVGVGVGVLSTSAKLFFYFQYVETHKQSFHPLFFNWYLSNEKTAFVDKSRSEPSIFFI